VKNRPHTQHPDGRPPGRPFSSVPPAPSLDAPGHHAPSPPTLPSRSFREPRHRAPREDSRPGLLPGRRLRPFIRNPLKSAPAAFFAPALSKQVILRVSPEGSPGRISARVSARTAAQAFHPQPLKSAPAAFFAPTPSKQVILRASPEGSPGRISAQVSARTAAQAFHAHPPKINPSGLLRVNPFQAGHSEGFARGLPGKNLSPGFCQDGGSGLSSATPSNQFRRPSSSAGTPPFT
jgi:hypothetical protein